MTGMHTMGGRTVRHRMRRVADVWLARALVLEDKHTEVTYLWTQSHTELKCEKGVGSYLPNVAADLMSGYGADVQ